LMSRPWLNMKKLPAPPPAPVTEVAAAAEIG
jgi:hypothetical protein